MDLSFIPECYIDTNLVETLVPPQRGYNHQKGCGTVTKVMKENFADDFAVGIVDKDKRELDYLNEFDLILAKGNIEFHKHKTRNHFIIRIIPAMERFILYNVNEANINLEEFEIPSNFDQFKKTSKTVNSKKDHRFKNLFRTLKEHRLADLELLTRCITYLKEHPYDWDINELKVLLTTM